MEARELKELKPCPFCGEKRIQKGQALIQIGPYNNVFECSRCRMHFEPPAATWDDCIKMWNQRADLRETRNRV